MEGIQIYKKLAWLNELPADEAENVFRQCCGSREWARVMADSRPFAMLEHLFKRADDIWFSLAVDDWLEAFAAHPKIGARGERAGVESAEAKVRDRLVEANSLYEAKFGFIFVVCAGGKTADEVAAICLARLGNSLEIELQIAAEEQRKITNIRLEKLLER